jgi:hypothetical protein
MDGFDRTWYEITRDAAFAAIANAWAKERGRSPIGLVSGHESAAAAA